MENKIVPVVKPPEIYYLNITILFLNMNTFINLMD